MNKIMKDKIRFAKLDLNNHIKTGMPLYIIEDQIEYIQKLYSQSVTTKTDRHDQYNFIAKHNEYIQEATKTRIKFINYFLYNLDEQDEYFKKPDNIKGMQFELKQLEDSLTA